MWVHLKEGSDESPMDRLENDGGKETVATLSLSYITVSY